MTVPAQRASVPAKQSPSAEFLRAVLAGDSASLKACLSGGESADDMFDFNGSHLSPLHLACINGQLAALEQLVQSSKLSSAGVNRISSHGESPLFVASAYGHEQLVRRLVQLGADVDQPQRLGCTPLWAAAQNGHAAVTRLLISCQADVNRARTSVGSTPIYMAAQNGHWGIVTLLAEAMADVDFRKTDGCTPMYIAAQKGHRQAVSVLLKAQADANQQQDRGRTPVYAAAQEGHLEVVEVLTRAGVDVNLRQIQGATPLFIASQFGRVQIVRQLLQFGVPDLNLPETDGATPVYVASQDGHLAVVRDLVGRMADVDQAMQNGSTPLLIAAQNGHNLVVQTLLKAKADSNPCRLAPLYAASGYGHLSIVDYLLEAGAKPNPDSDKNEALPLQIAVQCNHVQIVHRLIRAQVDVNQVNRHGTTALYAAAQEGHWEIALALIAANADADLTGHVQLAAPIHISSQLGHTRIVRLLLSAAQANVNLQVSNGCTALYLASQEGHCEAVEELLAATVIDVDLANYAGCSPLYAASQKGHTNVVDRLLSAGASTELLASDGTSALWIAAQNGHSPIVDNLIKFGASLDTQQRDGYTAVHVASQYGHVRVVRSLSAAGADLDIRAANGASPVFSAAQNGHEIVVHLLIAAQADLSAVRWPRISPLLIATSQGHHKVVQALIAAQVEIESVCLQAACLNCDLFTAALLARAQSSDEFILSASLVQQDCLKISESKIEPTFPAQVDYFPETPSNEASLLLNQCLTQSGFTESRAALQSAAADVLEQITSRYTSQQIFVVGSFSEGWGNSLTSLDGRTDSESDIDVMELITGRLYHLKDFCDCSETEGETMNRCEYTNGHILCAGFASNPARPWRGSALKPAVDRVSACRLCCYPPIAPLQPSRLARSNIPQSVLQSLRLELAASPCHLVHAAPPGQAGKQLRVSTTFLERRLLRSLNTVQGQMFILLKFLVKKVIGRRVQGLKAYHAKTVTFRMLEETPCEQWQPQSLLSLTRRSLQMLLDCVERGCSNENLDGRVMEHFFLKDAGLYLKGADKSTAREIALVLTDVIYHLPENLMKFKDSLSVLPQSGSFYFHPFQILPINDEAAVFQASGLFKKIHSKSDYTMAYSVVREALGLLTQKEAIESDVLELLNTLPDCVRTAREALRALSCLKFDNRVAATETLVEFSDRGRTACRWIEWPAGRSAREATKDFVWNHLTQTDSAWKFCFEFDSDPKFHFLTGGSFIEKYFPTRLETNSDEFYINFDALLRSLCIELLDAELSRKLSRDWAAESLQGDQPDLQELLACLHYCPDWGLGQSLLSKYHSVVDRCLDREQLQSLLSGAASVQRKV